MKLKIKMFSGTGQQLLDFELDNADNEKEIGIVDEVPSIDSVKPVEEIKDISKTNTIKSVLIDMDNGNGEETFEIPDLEKFKNSNVSKIETTITTDVGKSVEELTDKEIADITAKWKENTVTVTEEGSDTVDSIKTIEENVDQNDNEKEDIDDEEKPVTGNAIFEQGVYQRTLAEIHSKVREKIYLEHVKGKAIEDIALEFNVSEDDTRRVISNKDIKIMKDSSLIKKIQKDYKVNGYHVEKLSEIYRISKSTITMIVTEPIKLKELGIRKTYKFLPVQKKLELYNEYHEKGIANGVLARKYGVTTSTVWRIVNNLDNSLKQYMKTI